MSTQAATTRSTAVAELRNAQRDAILRTLKTAGQRLTLTQLADAIDATLSETATALVLLRDAQLLDVERAPVTEWVEGYAAIGRCTFDATAAAVQS